jgi:hypothetical protein
MRRKVACFAGRMNMLQSKRNRQRFTDGLHVLGVGLRFGAKMVIDMNHRHRPLTDRLTCKQQRQGICSPTHAKHKRLRGIPAATSGHPPPDLGDQGMTPCL